MEFTGKGFRLKKINRQNVSKVFSNNAVNGLPTTPALNGICSTYLNAEI